VYARLRAAAQDGSLRRGEKITERDLAARLKVSPTPVREALRQLIHERVVERVGSWSLRIADYGAEAVREAAEMEARLWGLAARFAACKRSADLLAQSRVFSDRERYLRTAERLMRTSTGTSRTPSPAARRAPATAPWAGR
jgi:DNA-binding GntR family transcriptional regulator